MAVSLDSHSLFRALSRPLPAVWAALISYSVVPVLGWLGGQLLPDPQLRIGLMIITSVPCTLASAALWTRMSGGNDAVALLTILMTTATSWFATTGWLLFITGAQVALNPLEMMGEMVLVLVVPVVLGQALRSIPRLALISVRFKETIGVASRLLILVVLVKALVSLREKLDDPDTALGAGLLTTGVICLAVHLLALGCGWWSSARLGFDRSSGIAVSFSCSQKTLPVALFLLEAYFPSAPLAVVPLVFYHGGQLIADTLIADRFARTGLRGQGATI
jgi:sodium/bile acid cotransporter 7